MRPLAQSIPEDFDGAAFVLTDMDDTLTFRGRLSARTYEALERLQDGGIRVIPVTAAPAGWCDQMVRMWPIDAVIAENGGISMLRTSRGVQHAYWHDATTLAATQRHLSDLREHVRARLPSTSVAADQPFRLTSLAFDRPSTREACDELCSLIRASGSDTTVNSLWVLAWLGGYDKLSAARRFMRTAYGIDIDTDRNLIVYVGDSTNDAPMFQHFPRSVGVSTVMDYLSELIRAPTWITRGPGGDGFVEVADAILAARRYRPLHR
jgi:HAD superfamily hydrolase (TIGR01484 family)